jgi:26S proteasome regulatory subunit T5
MDLERRLKENREKLKLNTQLPHMVANVGEILDPEEEEDPHDGSGFNVKRSGNEQKEVKQKSLVIKTTGRHTVYLPVPGLVESDDLKPGELIAVNKESFIVFEKLPAEYDSRVMAMEVDERPTEDYTDIGGLDKQIEELTEAIVLPMTHKERFINIGIRPPKGLLLHGPPGTGKTLMARACAAQTKATFLKLAGPQLV